MITEDYEKIYEFDSREFPPLVPLDFLDWLSKSEYGELRHKNRVSCMEMDRLIRTIDRKIREGFKKDCLEKCISFLNIGMNLKQVLCKLKEFTEEEN